MTDAFLINKYSSMSIEQIEASILELNERMGNYEIRRRMMPEDIELLEEEISYASLVRDFLRSNGGRD